MFSEKLIELISALTCLPSIGNKTAQRLAIHLLQNDKEGAERLSKSLSEAVKSVKTCSVCRNISDENICLVCKDDARNKKQICIVEGPMDALAIEQSVKYTGVYFILMGHLSPLDGIGPYELGLNILEERFSKEKVDELILATNITVEGAATAHYISEMASKYSIKVSRLAFGIPMGGELDYVDKKTLGHAFSTRSLIK